MDTIDKFEIIKIAAPVLDTKFDKLIYAVSPWHKKYTINHPDINNIINKDDYIKEKDKDRYKCLSCKSSLILKAGTVKMWHFSHKANEKCVNRKDQMILGTFDKDGFLISSKGGGESDDHITAKYKLYQWLHERRLITVLGPKCVNCSNCLPKVDIEYQDGDEIKPEYSTKSNNSNIRVDVAIVNNNEPRFIFEICHTNKSTNRPSPWFEIHASEINNKNLIVDEVVILQDIKYYYCNNCPENHLSKQIEIMKSTCENKEIIMNKGLSQQINVHKNKEYDEDIISNKNLSQKIESFRGKEIINREENLKRTIIEEYVKTIELLVKALELKKFSYCEAISRKLLDYNKDCNCPRIRTFFILSLSMCEYETCEFLVKIGYNLNLEDYLYVNIFYEQLRCNNFTTCRYLLNKKVKIDFNSKTNDEYILSFLSKSYSNKTPEDIKRFFKRRSFLIKHGAGENLTNKDLIKLIMVAIKYNDHKTTKILIDRGLIPIIYEKDVTYNEDFYKIFVIISPFILQFSEDKLLYMSAKTSNLYMLKQLYTYSKTVNLSQILVDGYTPLLYSYINNNNEVKDFLLYTVKVDIFIKINYNGLYSTVEEIFNKTNMTPKKLKLVINK